MGIGDFFSLLVSTLNPFAYKELMHKKKRETLWYFFTLLFFCVLISGILSIPHLLHLPENVESTFSKFSAFNITNVDIRMNEPLVLLNDPFIVMDLSENRSMEKEFILITKTDVYIKKFRPDIMKLKVFEPEQRPIADYSDVISDFRMIKGTYWLLFIFMLPSIFFTVYVFNMLKYLALISLAALIGSIVCLIRKSKLKLTHIMRAGIFSSTGLIFLGLALAPLIDLGPVPLLYYAIFFSVSLSMAGSRNG